MRAFSSLLMLWVAVAVPACAGGQPPQFHAAADKDNQISSRTENGTTVIDVRSPGGIGRAEIEFLSGNYPAEIILRLHVTGLEGFRLSYGTVTVSASASGTSDTVIQSLIQPGGAERTIAPSNPLWMDIQPEQVYFEIKLPNAFTQEKPDSFSFEWVDFYR